MSASIAGWDFSCPIFVTCTTWVVTTPRLRPLLQEAHVRELFAIPRGRHHGHHLMERAATRRWWRTVLPDSSGVQSQTAVTAYFSSKQLLLFGFVFSGAQSRTAVTVSSSSNLLLLFGVVFRSDAHFASNSGPTWLWAIPRRDSHRSHGAD